VLFFKRKNLKNLSDEELLEIFLQKQESIYLGELFERYMSLLYGLCLKYLKNRDDTKDMVMHIFEKLNEKLPQQTHIQNFKSWLYIFARNECLMQLRRDKKFLLQENAEECMENIPQTHLDIETQEEQELILELLEKGLQSLNEEQKRCIELFYLQKRSYQEIAEQTGYTMLQVKSYIQNGKRNLKKFIERS